MKSRLSVLELSAIGEAEGREGTGSWRSAEASKTDLAEDLGLGLEAWALRRATYMPLFSTHYSSRTTSQALNPKASVRTCI